MPQNSIVDMKEKLDEKYQKILILKMINERDRNHDQLHR
jgi:hypothetical protein